MFGTAAASSGPSAAENRERDDAALVPVADESEKKSEKEQEELDAEIVEIEESEMKKPRVGVRPVLPTKAEVEAHFPLHLEYRSWCAHLSRGQGEACAALERE